MIKYLAIGTVSKRLTNLASCIYIETRPLSKPVLGFWITWGPWRETSLLWEKTRRVPKVCPLRWLAARVEIFRKGSRRAYHLSLSKWITIVLFFFFFNLLWIFMNVTDFRGLISLNRAWVQVAQQNGLSADVWGGVACSTWSHPSGSTFEEHLLGGGVGLST